MTYNKKHYLLAYGLVIAVCLPAIINCMEKDTIQPLEEQRSEEERGEELYAAIQEENIPKVEDLIRQKADVNYIHAEKREEECRTVLEAAMLKSNVSIIKLLCEAGAEIDRYTLMFAYQHSHDPEFKILEYLLRSHRLSLEDFKEFKAWLEPYDGYEDQETGERLYYRNATVQAKSSGALAIVAKIEREQLP